MKHLDRPRLRLSHWVCQVCTDSLVCNDMSLHITRESRTRTLSLTRPEQLKAMGHPVRTRILQILEVEPSSAKELSTRLSMTHGKVGYHINVLADAGLIEIVEERPVRAVVEKVYATTYDRLRYAVEDTSADRLRFLLEQASREAAPEPVQPFGDHYRLMTAQMSIDRAAGFAERLADLVSEFGGSGGDGPQFAAVAAVYRTNIEPAS